jgi:hypothetical protein
MESTVGIAARNCGAVVCWQGRIGNLGFAPMTLISAAESRDQRVPNAKRPKNHRRWPRDRGQTKPPSP